MTIAGIILIVLALLAVAGALLHQRHDHVKGYGSTMGGQMMTAGIWTLAAVLVGVGTGMLVRWYVGVAAGVLLYVLSFVIRGKFENYLFDSAPQNPDSTGLPQ